MRTVTLLLLLSCSIPAAGCHGERAAARSTQPYRFVTMGADTLVITPLAARITTLTGYHEPESVRYDPEQDVFFISNIVGTGSAVDGNGYIVRVSAADYSAAQVFAEGSLNAPKGLALRGDVLWTADIDVLRGFDRRTGVAAGMIDLRPHGAVMLNDVAVGPDGALYVTDTGITMTETGVKHVGGDRVFAIAANGQVRVFSQAVGMPNGISWDAPRERWVIASFNMFGAGIFAVDPANGGATRIASGPGRFDGVEMLADGRIVATSWADQALYLVDGDRQLVIASGLVQPADLGVDTRRHRILVPQVLLGHIAVYEVATRATDPATD